METLTKGNVLKSAARRMITAVDNRIVIIVIVVTIVIIYLFLTNFLIGSPVYSSCINIFLSSSSVD